MLTNAISLMWEQDNEITSITYAAKNSKGNTVTRLSVLRLRGITFIWWQSKTKDKPSLKEDLFSINLFILYINFLNEREVGQGLKKNFERKLN